MTERFGDGSANAAAESRLDFPGSEKRTLRVDSTASTCSSSSSEGRRFGLGYFYAEPSKPKSRTAGVLLAGASGGVSAGAFDEGSHLPQLKARVSVGALLGRAVWFLLDVGSEFRWGTYRSKTIGASSLLYAFPGLLLLTLHPLHGGESPREATLQTEAFGWFVVAAASFCSDFVFAGRRESRLVRLVHLTDRWAASLAVLIQLCVNVPFWFGLSVECGGAGAFLLGLCVALKAASSLASSREAYKYLHSLWHVGGVAARVVMALWEAEGLAFRG